MCDDFPEFMKKMNLQIQEAQKSHKQDYKFQIKYVIVKLENKKQRRDRKTNKYIDKSLFKEIQKPGNRETVFFKECNSLPS